MKEATTQSQAETGTVNDAPTDPLANPATEQSSGPVIQAARRPKCGDAIIVSHAHIKEGVPARIDRVNPDSRGDAASVDLTIFSDDENNGMKMTGSKYDPTGQASDSWRFAE